MATIIAVAVNAEGRREVLGMATGPSEAEPFWTQFLRSLMRRGLRGDQLQSKFPKLAAMMRETEHEVLTFMDFPKEHRVKIHSTNVLERLNGEIKQRANVVGIFPNEGAVRRLVGPAIRLPGAPALA